MEFGLTVCPLERLLEAESILITVQIELTSLLIMNLVKSIK